MELVQTIKARARVVASFDEDGTLSVKVFADAEYAPGARTTAEVSGAEVPVQVRDAIARSLKAALADAQPRLGERISRAIHKSAEVAAARGEIR